MGILNAVIIVFIGIGIFIVAALLNHRNQNYYKMIAFDLDGTLVDSSRDIAASLSYVYDKNGFTGVDSEDIIPLLGGGIQNLISETLPEDTGEEIKNKCYREFCEYYREHAVDSTKTYPGIKTTLGYLRNKKGYKLAVITNKDEDIAKNIVDTLMPGKFDIVIGSTTSRRKKPAPDAMEYLANQMKIKTHLIVYVGDSDVDYEFAKNSNVNVILASWGYRSKEQLRVLGNRVSIVDFPGELHDLL